MRLLLTLALLATTPAWAEPVTVVSCYDGDTCRVLRAGSTTSVPVRLAGIDTPEVRARCPAEKAAALAARDRLRALVYPPAVVDLAAVTRDAKYNRLVGKLSVDGRDAGGVLVAEGLARAYTGGKRRGWC